jgi:nucleoside-diphosphate-sugar epimerase
MKNILVTGGCGFIGTNFIRYLLSNPEFEFSYRPISVTQRH